MNQLNDEEMRQYLSLRAKEQWERLTEEERAEIKKKQVQGMRRYWANLTPEERERITRRRVETMKANRLLRKKKGKG